MIYLGQTNIFLIFAPTFRLQKVLQYYTLCFIFPNKKIEKINKLFSL